MLWLMHWLAGEGPGGRRRFEIMMLVAGVILVLGQLVLVFGS